MRNSGARGGTPDLRAVGALSFVFVAAACGDSFGPPPPAPDQPPTLDDLQVETDEDTPVSVSLAPMDPDGDVLDVTIEAPRHGTLDRDGLDLTYTPETDWHGQEDLRVTVRAANGPGTSALLRIVVAPVNDAPVAAPDARAATEDVVQALLPSVLLGNDADVDGDALTISAVGSPTGGSVALDGGLVVFTAAADHTGAATFEYTVSDGAGGTDTATVTLTFGGVNDAPVAADDAATTAEDTPAELAAATLLANDTDVDGQTLSVAGVGGAVGGAVSLAGNTVTFTPAPDYVGAASFQYTVSDGALTDTGTVEVTVTPVNDAPVAVDDTVAGQEDTASTIDAATLLANDLDVEGDVLAVTGVANPTHGTVDLAGTTITFTPTADFAGAATFEYTVSDGNGGTDDGVVTVNVNGAPVAVDDATYTTRDVPVAIAGATLVANDTDFEGGALTVTAVGNATNGTAVLAAGDVTFTPASGFVGAAWFEYTVSDGAGGTDVGLVAVTVYVPSTCGDGVTEGIETCDDSNTVSGDGCSSTCVDETCGDGIVNDSSEVRPTSLELIWLATSCAGPATLSVQIDGTTVLTTEADSGTCDCAPGIRTAEITDPVAVALLSSAGNDLTVSFPGGNSVLAWAVIRGTDNGMEVTVFDQGDNGDGAARNPDLCNSNNAIDVTATTTGVLMTGFAEECDDGNADPGDGCDATCQREPLCGDGFLDAPERCDDGNTDPDDGCRADCLGLEVCGDGLLDADAGEECDDGNTGGLDGCDSTCQAEPGCGNGILETGEVCDDGNRDADDGCRADCRGLEVCGDGLIDSLAGEECDDGNTDDGDGCDSLCNLDDFVSVGPVLLSGALSCTTSRSNTGRKAAVDELGRPHAVMNCGGTAYAVTSTDRGATWTAPVSTGLTGISEVAIEGGPPGLVYAAAIAGGNLVFTRSTDGGATWESPQTLGTGFGDAEVSIDSHEDGVWVLVSNGNLAMFRNTAQGSGAFAATSLTQGNVYHEVIVDKISGDVWSLSDTPDFHVRRSPNGGVDFAAETAPPGLAFYSDWAGSNGYLYVVGTGAASTDTDIDVIPMGSATTSAQAPGLPVCSTSEGRAIDADAIGNAYVVTPLDAGGIQLDRLVFGASAVEASDVRSVAASGSWPAVAALPNNSGAVVVYTVGAEVYASVIVY